MATRVVCIFDANGQSSGENVPDHTASFVAWERADNGITFDTLRVNASFAQQQAALYASNSTSILDQTVPSFAYISLATLVGETTAKALIVEAATYINALTAPYKSTLQRQIVFLQQYPEVVAQIEFFTYDGLLAPFSTVTRSPNKTYSTFLACQQHLLSRGTVHINSKMASDYPIINPNYYTVPFDFKVATAGIAYMRKIGATPQFSAIFGTEVTPGQCRTILLPSVLVPSFTQSARPRWRRR